MRQRLSLAGIAVVLCFAPAVGAQTPSVRASYQVKQIAAGAVYLDGGSNDGLKEGMHLKVSRLTPGDARMSRKEIADLTIIGVASISAVCEVKESTEPIQTGDTAELSYEDSQSIQLVRTSKTLRHVAQTVSFTEGDPLEEELRTYVPRPPSPEVDRIRGEVSFEQSAIFDHTSGMQTMEEGLVVRADMTRIAGGYWNFTGYWRGQLTKSGGPAQVQTLNDLLNRTYRIGLYYNNPNSRYVAGVGRFLLPWAPSLSTIDGGYGGRKLGKDFTVGFFAGSTPDPTAWNYDPNRQMAGAFVAFEHGSYESVRYTSTAGLAVTRSNWHPEREFLFFENTLILNTKISIYDDTEVDKLAPALTSTGVSRVRLARSFATLRLQPVKALALDISHNYFRDVPTFDLRLLGTGLLDQFLFTGLSGGFRLQMTQQVGIYGNVGESKRDGDARASLNYTGGIVLKQLPALPGLPGLPRLRLPNLGALPHIPGLPRIRLPKLGALPQTPDLPKVKLPKLGALPQTPDLPGLPSRHFQTDIRYSHFASSFGSGSYESITLTKQLTDKLRFDVMAGLQSLSSPFVAQTRTKYGNANLDYLIGRHYLLGMGWTIYHGGSQNYDQTFINFGYRF